MSKIKNLLIMALCIVLGAVIAVGGTLAYLTDRESKANVFTVGDVEIELNEVYKQGAELVPGVDIQKEATITNTGKNDAWVWLTVLLPKEMGPYTAPESFSASNNVVHWNYPKESAPNITVDFNKTPVEIDTDGDGVKESYYQTNMLWKNILEVGNTTGVMLSKVYMDTRVDIDPDGNMYWVVDGVATDLNWNVKEKGNPVIHVSAYAIQAENFKDVEAAYKAYNTQWGVNGTEYAKPSVLIPKDAVPISDFEGFTTALTTGGNYEITAPFTVEGILNVSADTAFYNADSANVVTFAKNARLKTAENADLSLYGVKIDGGGSYTLDDSGFKYDNTKTINTDAILMAFAGSTLTLGEGTVIENVVSQYSAVAWAEGTVDNRATIILEGATIQNCAGGSGSIINVDRYGDVYIEEGTVIANNVSHTGNHGIIRIYNENWDAVNASTLTVNGGEISSNYFSANGMIGLYYAKMTMNGGKITNNAFANLGNKFYCMVYVHSNSQFVMNGGEISGNTITEGAINAINSEVEGAITFNGGTVTNNSNSRNENKDALAAVCYPNAVAFSDGTGKILVISEEANLTGTVYSHANLNDQVDKKYVELSEFVAK